MNEHGFWNKVRGALHNPPRSVCRKLTDLYTAGTPDCFYVLDGVTGFLELKYVPAWPVRASTPIKVGLSVEQRRYLEMLLAAGARAHVLLGVAQEWYLLDPAYVPVDGRVERWQLPKNGQVVNIYSGTFREIQTHLREVLTQTLEPGV